MSLDTGKPILKNGIVVLLTLMYTREVDSIEEFAEELSTLIYDFVKSGVLEVDEGIDVNTTGTATAHTGQTVEKGTGRIK